MPDSSGLPEFKAAPPAPSSLLRYKAPKGLKTAGVAVLAVAGVVVAMGAITRVNANQTVKAWTADQTIPTVKLVKLKGDLGDNSLVLPGDVQAFNDAPIHARAPGYLKKWYVDIGAPVKAGQVLADIDTPDLDQQTAQAKADLAVAVANQQLAESTAKRWQGLLARDAVARQEADEKNGDFAAKTAQVNAARANLQRLQALEGFKHITAPFDGVVTSRSTDIGALISVGGPTDTPLFTVADEKRLRIYVRVPQSYSARVKPGMTVSFTVPEYPGRVFKAQATTTARAINTASGTLLMQLQTDNADGALKPGDYAQVTFDLPGQASAVQVPASALTFRHSGMAVAVVGPGSRAVIKPITIARDYGTSVEVKSGLAPSDRVIDNPPDSLESGDLVRVPGGGA
jgi:RND family efflux transporter MFP subunit